MPALHRWVGNPLLSFIGRIFFRAELGDFHCGLRGFNTSAIRNLKLRSHGMEFTSEMVVRCRLARMRIAEVPTTLNYKLCERRIQLVCWIGQSYQYSRIGVVPAVSIPRNPCKDTWLRTGHCWCGKRRARMAKCSIGSQADRIAHASMCCGHCCN
jgi:hypothetical protein